MRSIHPATLAALKQDHINAILVKLHTKPTALCLCNKPFDVSYNGDTYLGNGKLIKAGQLSQSTELTIDAITLEFDAAEPSIVSIFLNNSQAAARVEIYYAILNNDYSIAGTPILDKIRSVDGDPEIIDDPSRGQAIIKIKASSDWANIKAKNGTVTTPESQHRYFPNDTGFDFAPVAQKEIKWGRD